MLSVPYSIELNDIPLFVGKSFTGPQFKEMVVDWFEQLYADGEASGRVMTVALHPFIVNQPSRHRHLANWSTTLRQWHTMPHRWSLVHRRNHRIHKGG